MQSELKNRSTQLRTLAFVSVVLSTVASAACAMLFPMVLHYIREVGNEIESEIQFCKSRSRDLWKGVLEVHLHDGGDTKSAAEALFWLKSLETYEPDEVLMSRPKVKRQTFNQTMSNVTLRMREPYLMNRTMEDVVDYVDEDETEGEEQDDPGIESSDSIILEIRQITELICCTCHRGMPGPDGSPGSNGRPGTPGTMGFPGRNGSPATSVIPVDMFPPQCPCESKDGPDGSQGQKGAPGESGVDGQPGQDGTTGSPGKPGPAGPKGLPGIDGDKGPKGTAGIRIPQPGDVGPNGAPGPPGSNGAPGRLGSEGKPGDKGLAGQPGNPGTNGNDGIVGKRGERGDPGSEGEVGSCTHCPTVRLAPGY